jgi:small subunit ribosomal protein S8
MSLTDPIADMLTRIRNAVRVRKNKVDVRRSRICLGIANILKRDGFVEDFKELEDDPQGNIRIYLKYGPDGEETIREIARVSKPGRRVYQKSGEIKPLLNGMGVSIFSTSKGILADYECRERNVGGEYLARVY